MTGPLRAVALLAVAAALAPGGTPAGGAPGVTVPAGTLRVGQRVLVGLDGWPAGTVQAEVCGNAARRGVLDCATGAATHGQVPPTGRATLPVLVAAPPVACPCVLRVRTPTGTASAVTDLALTGVDAPAVAPTVPAGLTLVRVHAVDRSGPRGWFGLPGELAVRITLHNPGAQDVTDPPLQLTVGPPGQARTIVAAPALGRIAAGQTREYHVPVSTGTAPFGSYEVEGRIVTPGRPVAFTVAAARRPWGLPVAAAVLTVVSLLARPARRRAEDGPVVVAAGVSTPPLPGG
ncbi:hypothetical protein [Micromonospora rifamycinica]|uniref:Neocarzinostatin family protein n=1 Tax=Micromonospora rifamycinica TaxID=291594 RepID=A0A120F8I0_9ACTN|nr:hypothetical protein [Micromonospora rifamycinica]KWV31852.1 hypothetical protein AWV63_15435 [Micromonospora rifamycinica]SCG46019.1 hypothetical protein GA0070623_1314 [Micromonospora rifamycinica]